MKSKKHFRCILQKDNLDICFYRFQGEKTITTKNISGNTVISEETYKLVTQMLERVNEVFKIDFRYDFELITMLSTHLMPLEIRAKHGIAVHNSLADDIRHNVILSYNMAIIACDTLEQKIGVKLPMYEIAFVTLPFSLALKRKWKNQSLPAQLFKHFNTGISYFLPVIIAGGMLFSFTLITGKIDNGAIVPSNQSFQNIYDIGQAGFAMMVPVICAYIAYAIDMLIGAGIIVLILAFTKPNLEEI